MRNKLTKILRSIIIFEFFVLYDKINHMNIFSEKIETNKQEELKKFILQNFEADLNPKQYAFWEIKNKDFVATFYNSGKFVIQGKNINLLLEKLSELNIIETGKLNPTPDEVHKKEIADTTTQLLNYSCYIGTDESGKGDFFGPLVIAGVLLNKKNHAIFEELGIKDSKTLKDADMIKMSQQIQKHSVYSVVSISNQKYNELYTNFKNLNKLLAWGHAKVIENILEKEKCDYALSDKFGDESLILNALQKHGQKIKLEQRTKAESDIAVAAASVLARATFVQKMKTMENFYGCKFPKGCNNIVKDSAGEFIKKYGKDRLSEVCKKHFKTYNELN